MSLEEAVENALNFDAAKIGPVANAFFWDRSNVAAIMGPVGSAKTTTSLMKPLAVACEQEPSKSGIRFYKHVIIRDTYRNLSNTTIPSWLSWIPKEFGEFKGGGSGEPASHKIRFRHGQDGTIIDAWFVFLAIGDQNVEDVLRGMECTTGYLNEMDRLNPGVLKFLRGRCGRYPPKKIATPTFSGVWGDLNAPEEDNYCADLFVFNKPDEFKFFIQPGGLEPNAENMDNLPPNYYQNQIAGQTEDYIRRMINNQIGFSREGKPVYSSFKDNVHVAQKILEPIPGLPLYLGADAGLTPAVIIGQRLGDGQWLVLDELLAEDTGAWRFGEKLNILLRDKYPGFKIAEATYDPAGDSKNVGDKQERSWAEIMRQVTGIRWRPAQSNSPLIRTEAVIGCLNRMIDGKPGLLLSPNCKTLRRGFLSGYYLKDGSPCKNEYSHPHDGLQYLVLGGGEYLEVMGRIKRRKEAAKTTIIKTNFRIFNHG